MENFDKEYIAHSENDRGIKQTMREHSISVSKFMRGFALSESYADLYEFCGLTHDIGKYSNAFQRHITGENIKTKHSIYGAMYAQDNSLMEVAFPVFGHHAGLPDNPELRQNIEAERNTNNGTYSEILTNWKNDTQDAVRNLDDTAFRNLSDILLQELFVRMLFSALVDADSLDTEKHFQEAKFLARNPQIFDPTKLLEKLQRRFDSFENDPKKKELIINRLRNDVRLYAESKANFPQGFFSLTLPTGLGKTLCSINWALHHAQCHPNIKRIIIVLPFLNIIDQTADELKMIFNDGGNDDYVLEHHSNVIYANEGYGEDYNPKQLATENWDYPIIITTSVQFFESLFSNTRAACRKLHNIQDSIIIFDEIQTLPMNVTEPTLMMLDNLQRLCRCSLLFCTATQPDFDARDGFRGIHIEPLVDNPKRVFEETKRVIYHPLNGYEELPISELAEAVVKKQVSALVVFNTKKKAKMFFEEVRGCDGFTLFHLSTNMCPAHRKQVIRDIRNALANKERIVVSSTQLIEAGVDMDFPTVYRELAPLESIIQSAGRCNREGKFEKGDVYLFALTESGQPSKQYRSWAEFANLLYKGNEEKLYTHDFYSFYYRKLVENFGDTDKYKITEDRKRFLFQTVADKYKIIDNNTQPVFVYQYNEKSRELYNRIKDQDYLSRQERQEVTQYCVQVYYKFIEDNSALIGFEQCGISIWYGSYDKDFGLPFKDEFNPVI